MSHRMHIRLVVILIVVLLAGCSDHSTDSGSVALHQPFPADGATNVPVTAELAWQSAFAPNSGVHYKVAISLLPDPGDADANQQNQSPGGFHPGQTYYWRVEAHFPTGHIFRSPIWRFRTAEKFEYPLEIGTVWDYEIRQWFSDITIFDSLIYPLYDQTYGATVTVDGLDTLVENGKPAFRLAEVIYGPEIYPNVSYSWFNNENTGFWNYAYDGPSSGYAIPRKQVAMIHSGGDKRIGFLMEVGITGLRASTDAGPYTFDPARSLAYPLHIGQEWLFVDGLGTGTIRKRIVDQRRIEVLGEQRDCWVVKWIYYSHPLRVDEEISVVDYISDDGLMKREIAVRYVQYTAPEGEIAAIATWNQEITLRSMEQSEP